MEASISLRRPRCANKDVSTIVSLQLVSRVGRENSIFIDKPPIRTKVENPAYKMVSM
jgi:hypothetical protein